MIAVSRPLTARGSLAGRVISATRYFAARPPTPSGFQGCAFAAESPERAEESREEGRGAGSPPAAGPSRKPGSAASWSWEPRNLPNLPVPTRRGAHGRGPVRKRASRETFSPAPALVPGAGSQPWTRRAAGFPRPPAAAARRGRARRPSPGLGVPCPPSPIPVSGAQCPDQSPPSGTLFPPSFLPPFPPSISLPSTGNSEAAPELASRRPALRPGPFGDPTCHLRPLLGAHSPARALPLPPPLLPGTLSLRAPGDGSDLSSSSCSSGRAPAPPRSG